MNIIISLENITSYVPYWSLFHIFFDSLFYFSFHIFVPFGWYIVQRIIFSSGFFWDPVIKVLVDLLWKILIRLNRIEIIGSFNLWFFIFYFLLCALRVFLFNFIGTLKRRLLLILWKLLTRISVIFICIFFGNFDFDAEFVDHC